MKYELHFERKKMGAQVRSVQHQPEKNGKRKEQDSSEEDQIDQELLEEEQEYYDDDNETDQYDNEDAYYETDDQLSQEEGSRQTADRPRMVALIKPIAVAAAAKPAAAAAGPQGQLHGKVRGQKTLNFFFTW